MTPDLSAIRARAEAATPGPWTVKFSMNVEAPDPRGGMMCPLSNSGLPTEQKEANVAFIAASRTDIPDLLTEIERLQSLLAPLNGESAEIVMRELRRMKTEPR